MRWRLGPFCTNTRLKRPLSGMKLGPNRGTRLTEAFMLPFPEDEGPADGGLMLLPVMAKEVEGAGMRLETGAGVTEVTTTSSSSEVSLSSSILI